MPAPQLSPSALAATNANNTRFSVYILIILSAIVLLVAIYRLTISTIRYVRILTCLTDSRQHFFKQPNRTFGWVKQHLLYAPLLTRCHSYQMRIGPIEVGILPTRFQSFLITALVAMNVVLCVYGIEWHGPLTIKLRHLRNRSGILAIVNMIPLVLIANRNNPLIRVLNVSFDTFNLLHRWFGRIVVSLAVTHGVVEITSMITGVTAGKKVHPSGITIFTQTLKEERFMLWGFVAFVAMATIILTSFTAFRHAFYETFLHIHIALIALVLAALWIHLDGLSQQNYLKAVIALWAIERFFRLCSLLYNNAGQTMTHADIEVIPGEALRVHMRFARPCRIKPGQYIFFSVPSIGLWTSHPFSIAWSGDETQHVDLDDDLEKCYSSVLMTPETLSRPQTSISLIIRRRSGFTNHLYRKASSTPTSRLSLRALIEGPYGNPTPLSSYGTIMLIAGGIGITHHVPHLRSILAAYAAHTTATRRLTLIWIIRSPEHLEWIRPWMTTILAMPKRREILRIQLFVTQPRGSKEIHSPSETVQMFPGKPNVEALVEREAREQVGAMAVAVCGPGGLGDDARRAVRKRVKERNIDFLEEGFGW